MRSFTREWKKMSKRNLMGKIKAFAHIRGIRLAVELVHHYFYSSSSYTSSSSSRSLFSALQVNKTWLKLLSVRFCITNFFCSNDFPIWKNYIYFLLICLHYYEMFSSNLTSQMYVDFPRLFFTLVCKKMVLHFPRHTLWALNWINSAHIWCIIFSLTVLPYILIFSELISTNSMKKRLWVLLSIGISFSWLSTSPVEELSHLFVFCAVCSWMDYFLLND